VSRAAEAAALLAAKASPADAETYKHWLVEIADEVVGAASSGGLLGIGGETVTENERNFRDELAKALAG
jgi:NTP pyrophosphatase (non-canonical NTP hydrolase)